MTQIIEMTGKRFGKLVVTGYSHTAKGKRRYTCKCDCGSKTIAAGTDMRYGRHTSCGCGRKEALSKANKLKVERARERLERLNGATCSQAGA